MRFLKDIVKLGLLIGGLSFYWACATDLPPQLSEVAIELPETISFNYHVKPILSDKCFACHGMDKNSVKGDLRLHLEEHAYRQLPSGKTSIVPYRPRKSELVNRILSEDAEVQMPPPESPFSLTDLEKATLIKWIEQGATYQPHWAYLPPRKMVPSSKKDTWANNEIDHFVQQKLQSTGLIPSERASKENLIRKVSFSLTGLPPTLEAIDRFVKDSSATAYYNLVDRLLASPQYGERMAANWMDVARYADSDGYLDDKHRDFSPWRDWVIKAFNDNLSYEEFVTLQLAGDLLPNASQDQILPTAFNRLHRRNSEAGIVFEEFRTEYVADRTNTFGKAFLGLTMECAKCHDHKYDPISQKNYYELFSFFNNTHELGTAVYGPDQVPGPSLLLTNEEERAIVEYLQTEITQQSAQLVTDQHPKRSLVDNWIADTSSIIASIKQGANRDLVGHFSFETIQEKDKKLYVPNEVNSGQFAQTKEPYLQEGLDGKAFFVTDYSELTLPQKMGWFDHTDPFSVSLSIYPDTLYEEAGIFYHCENLRLGLKGYSLFLENNQLKFIIARSYPQNAIQIKTIKTLPVKQWSQVTITYDGSGTTDGVQIYLDGTPIEVERTGTQLYKSILFEPDIHTYGFAGFTIGKREKMKTFVGGGLDELKIYSRKLSVLEVLYQHQPKAFYSVVDPKDKLAHKELLTTHYFEHIDTEYHQVQQNLQTLRKQLTQQLDTIPEIMVMGDLPKQRPTHILNRGAYDDLGEEVYPSMPDNILPFTDKFPNNRLGLAQWLFDKKNPLTARVYVNRIWQMHFGRGLVGTSDDFGSQGNLPTHPELLDWLAVSFMESGWDIKQLHRLIVTSATYQQSSKIARELLAVDSNNELLARGPSFRLPAEMIRDNALAMSGLLVDKIGGKSVYPYQPEGLWDEISNKHWRYRYRQSQGEGLYRRSLYTIWKRTSPPPSMLLFDAADRDVCTVKRRQTSTPLQALTLLNDPQFIEAARVTATNILETETNRTAQLEKAFRLGTGRLPQAQELQTLEKFYLEEQQKFAARPTDANDYLSIGVQKYPTTTNIAELAALTTVVNGIMNTVEGYTLK
ncbi:MAG: DUF1553 domain-containing protein [Bacteroidota bacterium]